MSLILIGGAAVLLAIAVLPLFRHREEAEITEKAKIGAPGNFIRLSQGVTHYDMAGPEDGPVVVLVHGFSVPYYVWDRTIVALSSAGYRVIRYDLYGRGLSERPEIRYDRRLFVNQLAELLGALHIDGPVHLAGYSMGGAVVAAFVADYPEKTSSVFLIDPLCERYDIGILRIPLLGEYLAYGYYVPSMAVKQEADFFDPGKFPEWEHRFREQMRYRGFKRAILSTLRHFMDRDPTPDYEQMGRHGIPVLLIWGAEDRTLGITGASKLRSLLSPDFVWVEEAAHLPHYEYPDIVNPKVVHFLRTLTASRNISF